MWLAYLDESGNTGTRLDDPDQPIHYVAAILVREDRVGALTAAVDDLVAGVLQPGRTRATELHGAEIFGGDGSWSSLSPRERIEVYRTALSLLGSHEAKIAYASIDKRALAQRAAEGVGSARGVAPHLLALQFLIEKLQRYLEWQPHRLEQRALLVADETHEHERFALELLETMQGTGGPIGAGHPVPHIVDTVHFVRSETNRGVQLADLIVYAMNRAERARTNPTRANQAMHELWSDLIVPLRCTWRERWP